MTITPVPARLVIKGLSPREIGGGRADDPRNLAGPARPRAGDGPNRPLRELVEKLGLSAGQVFGFLREAVTGQAVSPPLFETMAIVGREKVLERVKRAIELLENYPAGRAARVTGRNK